MLYNNIFHLFVTFFSIQRYFKYIQTKYGTAPTTFLRRFVVSTRFGREGVSLNSLALKRDDIFRNEEKQPELNIAPSNDIAEVKKMLALFIADQSNPVIEREDSVGGKIYTYGFILFCSYLLVLFVRFYSIL